MQPLYPSIKANQHGYLDVDDIHQLYVEESGSPDGIPVLFIHGGPGAGSSLDDRRFFDPERYRIIVFDQRGAGRSRPHASLESNTTQELIGDIEKIRQHFKVEQWVLFGGSWGSTLALLYAQTYPDRVRAMVLRGIFLCRQKDLDWFYQGGASHIFPDYWENFLAPIPVEQQKHCIQSYYQLLVGDNELAKMNAAKHWSLWEARCATFRPNSDIIHAFSDCHMALSLARIEAHYFMHGAFIEENQILLNAHKLEGIPGIIIHGRYDAICPLDNAWELQRRWPAAELHIIRDAGHSSREPSMLDALVKATNDVIKRLEAE
ncbi:prolyl aminopeptidase [Candidatus Endobugula sertula]|uniref:Proline iminopeptidase n=1 Tax=Candidatus Endobugula sertula TaxID=62101 RepID=A0A1D2QRL2_9GAMM|nr:prolyl aminopeptidase [Candidatus Endobugula sertula]